MKLSHTRARTSAVFDDPNLVCVDSTGWITEDDCTDTVHPSVAGHAKIAGQLIAALETHTSLRRPG